MWLLLYVLLCYSFHFRVIFGRVALKQILSSKGPSINVTVYLVKMKQVNTTIKSTKEMS